MQQPLFDSPPKLPNFITNKQTAKTGFINLAFLMLDGLYDIERDLECVGEPLESIQARMPYPAEPRRGNGVSYVTCSRCGRDRDPLRLNLRGGWLCLRCHREFMVWMGWQDEQGHMLPDCDACGGINQSRCPKQCGESEYARQEEFLKTYFLATSDNTPLQ